MIGTESLIDRKAHVPTGRVPLEDVVWFGASSADKPGPPLPKQWKDRERCHPSDANTSADAFVARQKTHVGSALLVTVS